MKHLSLLPIAKKVGPILLLPKTLSKPSPPPLLPPYFPPFHFLAKGYEIICTC